MLLFMFSSLICFHEKGKIAQVIRMLSKAVDLEIEMHAHDDLGLATVNWYVTTDA